MSDLQIRRRHVASCKVAAPDAINQCQCPLYAEGRFDGRRVRRGFRTRNLVRALEMLRKWQGDPARAAIALAADRSISEAASLFAYDPARPITDTTRKMYRRRLADFSAFCASRGIRTISGISEDLSRAYLDSLPGRNGAPRKSSSRKLAMVQVKTFMRWMLKRRWLETDPLAALESRSARDERYSPDPLTQEQVAALVAAVPTIRTKAILFTFLYTGLRLIDVATLRWSAINLETGDFWIRSTEKTGAPFVIRIHEEMQSALRDWKRECPSLEYVFFSTSKTATTVSIDRTLRRLGKIAGVGGLHAHRLRDTFAIRALTTGTDIRTVQHLLGHSSVTTTERHYTIWVKEHMALANSAVARLDFVQHSEPGSPRPDTKGDTLGDSHRNVIPFRRRPA